MQYASVLLLLIVITMASASDNTEKPFYDVANAHAYFEEFVATHKREYKDEADREVHYRAFVANLEKINKLNKDSPTATFGINKFADYTEEESKSMFGFRKNKQT